MTILEEITDFAKEQARTIVESGMEHQPVMLALSSGGVNLIHMVEINKDNFRQRISGLLRKLDAYAYIYINEAWGTRLVMNSPRAKRVLSGEISISALPLDDREEILTVMVAENRKSFICWSAKIGYSPEGKRYLGEWEGIKGAIGGRLVLKEW